ncbi:beta-galactoside alpha-2,6-sialyltransferase 2-like [Lepeophtheirus salmonis]|uniref:beta-galactoside alpha-2,6-sialyltransferase 2-like n=1 Tax=Lepeophtheirus salmonis TaxID=72036 RepID=UPI00077F2A27|nr:beta-galactoside alpha-2,6-sialyltransferase 2-like [Lepeophtheirus salmonis]
MNFLGSFLFLFLCLLTTGTFTYLYIIWTTYWERVSKSEDSRDIHISHSIVRIKYDDTTGRFVANDGYELGEKAALGGSEVYQLVEENYFYEEGESEEMTRIKAFEKQVVSNLRKTFMDYGKKVLAGDFENRFKVKFMGRKGPLLEISKSSSELLCDMKKKVNIHIFRKGDNFFRSQQLDQYFMSSPLLSNKTFNSCAIVTNAGSLINSGLGTYIDSHDFVMRFNNAPTFGHEKDVGSKTSLRVVNSQILSEPEFGFLDPKNLYSSSPVLVWDPTNYNASVAEWYSNPDRPFFETFFSKRLMKPEEPLYLLHPSSLWSLWNWLQSQSKWPLVPNPTTSGFLGLSIAVQHCSIIRIFEYIPSLRYSDKCHYYGNNVESEVGSGGPCTYGAWHPVSAEKLMALALNIGKKKEVYSNGFLTIPGFRGLKC